MSYRIKLALSVCGLVLATGVVLIYLAFRSARVSTETLVDALFHEVSNHTVTHTRAFVLRAVPLVESLQRFADSGLALDDSDRLALQLLEILRVNPGLSWIHYSNEQGAFTGAYRTSDGRLRINQSHIVDGRSRLVEQEIDEAGRRTKVKEDNDSGYDPRNRPYYRKAKQERRLVWLPPYIFYDQNVPGISCAIPVDHPSGDLRGVLTIDFDLNALSGFIAGLSVSPQSRVFLFTADGTLLAHPKLHVEERAGRRGEGRLLTLADADDPLVDAYQKNLRAEHVAAVADDAFQLFEFRHGGQRYLASATPFRIGNDLEWVVGAVAPKADFLSEVWRSQALALAAAALALLVAAILAYLLAGSVSGPVHSLVDFMRGVGEGNLDARAELGGSKEFRELSVALNHMIADLRDRLRLRHSLHVATEVQQRLLPQEPPHVRGLDVAGHSTYCDETGGDYFDFLVLDEAAPESVLIALGDVMGHGVAAALVMAGARAVLRDRAGSVGSLSELLDRLNRLLSADHEGSRFMTMHLALADARAKTYRWVSAGHDPALIFDPASDRFEEIDAAQLPLGISDDVHYEEHCYQPLRAGQFITIGTDGVWEMPNTAGEQFGKERLRSAIRAAASGTAHQVIDSILRSLSEFRGECRPVDDVTFVVIKVE